MSAKCQNRKGCPPDAALRTRNSASRHVLIHEPLAHIDMLGKNVSILPKPDGVFRSPSALQRPFDDIDIQTGRNSASQECYRLIIRCDAPRSPAHDEPRRVEKRAQVVFVLVVAQLVFLGELPRAREPACEWSPSQIRANLVKGRPRRRRSLSFDESDCMIEIVDTIERWKAANDEGSLQNTDSRAAHTGDSSAAAARISLNSLSFNPPITISAMSRSL